MLLRGRNVNQLFYTAALAMAESGVRESSRNGDVTVFHTPVLTEFVRPCERVLFSKSRKANPFFHLAEAFWMLAGREDAHFLDQFVADFGARYAEDDGILHGAYGYRWRHAFTHDQIDEVVEVLIKNPTSRQAVIQMWSAELDLNQRFRDIPCNTHIYFRIHDSKLDMTVCCRSNDLVWGLFGANAVHFSILMEYLAHRLEVRVGSMFVLSNNLHTYDFNAHLINLNEYPEYYDHYSLHNVEPTPLFSGGGRNSLFMDELHRWLDAPTDRHATYQHEVFNILLVPMMRTHKAYKEQGALAAHTTLSHIEHTDWQRAAELWLSQRKRQ